jgi:signal transduction histidine kinase
LEEFNKRFAFILHDTKNAIGQLSLLVRNVEQFGHIESFRQDMTATLRHSVEKLQQLLAQLRGESAPASAPRQTPPTPTPVDVTALIERFVAEKRKLGLNVVMEAPVCVFAAIPDKEAFLGVLELVVTNAIDASPEGSSVSVQVRRSDRGAEVKVIDRGPGMSPEFIAGELFRPLRSTKSGGFGIGAYQARELMGQLGGKLDIDSKVGEGTTVSLSVPAAAAGQLAGV